MGARHPRSGEVVRTNQARPPGVRQPHRVLRLHPELQQEDLQSRMGQLPSRWAPRSLLGPRLWVQILLCAEPILILYLL